MGVICRLELSVPFERFMLPEWCVVFETLASIFSNFSGSGLLQGICRNLAVRNSHASRMLAFERHVALSLGVVSERFRSMMCCHWTPSVHHYHFCARVFVRLCKHTYRDRVIR